MSVDRRVVQAGPLGRPGDLQVRAAVLHQDGDVIPHPHTTRTQRPSESHGPLLQLGIDHGLSARTHDDGRGVRGPLGMEAGGHRSRRHRTGPGPHSDIFQITTGILRGVLRNLCDLKEGGGDRRGLIGDAARVLLDRGRTVRGAGQAGAGTWTGAHGGSAARSQTKGGGHNGHRHR